MMKKPIMTTRLTVNRRLENGKKILVGTLAQNNQGIFFQYEPTYLAKYSSLSPFKLPFDNQLHLCQETSHQGLFGVFADSLPDGWGTLLMDRVFRQHGIEPYQISPLDRLAYIANRALGALEYEPALNAIQYSDNTENIIDLYALGQEAQAVFEGETDNVLIQLANAGSSGGARPKAQIYVDRQFSQNISTLQKPNYDPWIIKFTSASLPLKHEEGLCEAAYLTLAQNLAIDVPDWSIIQVQSFHWLAMRRFDCTTTNGRNHLHSLCGLLDADYRLPSLDYNEVIKASQVLCQNPSVGQTQFIRAMFNLFAANQDDHSKNWAFLQNDAGQWQPAPFYDVTFSPTINGEHCTSYGGYGKMPSKKTIQQLAELASFSNWQHAKIKIEEIIEEIQTFPTVARELGISPKTIKMISHYQNELYQVNKRILA